MFKRGFTIVELIVVIVLIGILTGIGVVAANQVQKDIRDNKRKSDIIAIQNELEKFYSKNGEYPAGCTVNCGSWFYTDNISTGVDGAGVGTPLLTPTATIDTIRNYLPGVPKSIGDPDKTNNDNPFNVSDGYFYIGGAINNRQLSTEYSSTSEYTPGPDLDRKKCRIRTLLYGNQTSSYVIGYYSELDNKWIFKTGRHGRPLDIIATSDASCVL